MRGSFWFKGPLQRWNAFWFPTRSAFDLGLCRLVFFALFFYENTWRQPWKWAAIDPGLREPISFFRWWPDFVLSAAQLHSAQALWVVALILAAMGLATRLSTLLAFLLTLYLVGLEQNFGKIHHSEALATVCMGVLAFSRCGDSWSLDRLWRSWRGHPPEAARAAYFWPLRLIQSYMVLTYFSAAVQKLRYSGLDGWVFSDNLARILTSRGQPAGLWLAQFPELCQLAAAGILLLELGAPLALLGARWAAFWISGLFLFHLSAWGLLGIDGAFKSQLICFTFWLPWHRLWTWSQKKIQTTKASAFLHRH